MRGHVRRRTRRTAPVRRARAVRGDRPVFVRRADPVDNGHREAGTCTLPEVRSSTFGFPGRMTPFGAVVEVDVAGSAEAVLIPGELARGSDRSHVEKAREQGAAREVTVERIMEVLDGDEYGGSRPRAGGRGGAGTGG